MFDQHMDVKLQSAMLFQKKKDVHSPDVCTKPRWFDTQNPMEVIRRI